MSINEAREFLKRHNRDQDIIEFDTSSATVALAAQALGCHPGQIAKSLAFRRDQGARLVLAAGDRAIDNKAYREQFGEKARMLEPAELPLLVGHEMGGVCPFGIKENVEVFLDESLRAHETVYPACGSSNSAIALSLAELESLLPGAVWVAVTKGRTGG